VTELSVAVAARIKELRIAKGLSQGRLADQVASRGTQMHQTTLSKIELGTQPIKLDELPAFAWALEVSFFELFPLELSTDQECRIVAATKRAEDAVLGLLAALRESTSAVTT